MYEQGLSNLKSLIETGRLPELVEAKQKRHQEKLENKGENEPLPLAVCAKARTAARRLSRLSMRFLWLLIGLMLPKRGDINSQRRGIASSVPLDLDCHMPQTNRVRAVG